MLAALLALLLGLWAWSAPPAAGRQHMFNFMSPSQDGAFVIEARTAVTSGISSYLRHFNERLKTPEEQMRGTRVLSNPPGTTIIAKWTRQFWPGAWGNGWIDRWMLPPDERSGEGATWAIRMAFVMHAMWVLSIIPCYGLARQFLPPGGAAAAALIMWFNPSTVLFTPGKDPAQLLTVALMLWAGVASFRTRSAPVSSALAFVSGMILVAGTVLGLIHLWIALTCVLAMAWQSIRQRMGGDTQAPARLILRQLLPAAAGAAAAVGLIDATTGWNVLSTLLAVQRRFSEIQPTIRLDHRLWLLIGLPIFLLFVSPSLYALLALNVRRLLHPPQRKSRGFGRVLLICTLGMMAITYLLGVPYELPRLWVVFLPLLVLAASIDLPLMHGHNAAHRAWKALALLAAVNVIFTAVHWTRFDVRESEYRMITQRLWR
jgi:hypothetical protein